LIDKLVTVLIPTSVIPSHPSTSIIEETLQSIAWHLPKSRMIILADGLRDEQKDAAPRYSTYLYKLNQLLLSEWRSTKEGDTFSRRIYEWNRHTHQVGMLRDVLSEVTTPYIIFVEHDTPLVKRPIEWDAIYMELAAGTVNSVRFLPDPQILECHEHLMGQTIETSRLRLRETIQFSARPHIATVDFYKKILSYFSPEAKAFVEDGIYTHCVNAPWSEFKLAIYLDPKGKDSKFSYHLDGRAASRKFDELQVF